MDQKIQEFIELTIEMKKWESTPIKSNGLYKKRHKIFKSLKSESKLHLLEPLLEHDDIDVQSRAASYYLLVDEQKALRKLREIAKRGGMKGFEIELLLSQWDKGELIIDHE